MLDNYKKILVGIDGSVEATKAFDKAVATALRNDAELVIANVIDLRAFQSISAYDSVVADDTHKGAENLINDFADEAKKLALKKSKLVLNLVLQKSCLAKLFQKKKKLASLFLEQLVFLTLNVSLSVQWRITLSKMHHAMSSSFVNKIKKAEPLKAPFFYTSNTIYTRLTSKI